MKRVCSLVGLAVLVAGLLGAPAGALTVYTLGLGNPPVAAYPGPYAEVSVTLTSATTADIVFTSLSNGSETFLLADGGAAAVNVNAVSWALSNLSASNAGTGFSPGPLSNGGSGNQDGFGFFNQHINSSTAIRKARARSPSR